MDGGWGSECCFLCVRIGHSVPFGEKLFVVGQNKNILYDCGKDFTDTFYVKVNSISLSHIK